MTFCLKPRTVQPPNWCNGQDTYRPVYRLRTIINTVKCVYCPSIGRSFCPSTGTSGRAGAHLSELPTNTPLRPTQKSLLMSTRIYPFPHFLSFYSSSNCNWRSTTTFNYSAVIFEVGMEDKFASGNFLDRHRAKCGQ